jgi:hypothetical protein
MTMVEAERKGFPGCKINMAALAEVDAKLCAVFVECS